MARTKKNTTQIAENDAIQEFMETAKAEQENIISDNSETNKDIVEDSIKNEEPNKEVTDKETNIEENGLDDIDKEAIQGNETNAIFETKEVESNPDYIANNKESETDKTSENRDAKKDKPKNKISSKEMFGCDWLGLNYDF